ncbi:MAG: zinc-dependent dehydrogenase [Candidatus Geothermarchaeales archaeon]
MKVAVYYSPTDVRYEEVPRPEVKPGEIVVDMRACGLCGSDLMEWYLKDRAPLVLGHEPSGIVSEVGDGVVDLQPGDRVFAHHHVACLSCHYCAHGDFTLCQQFSQTHLDPGGFAESFKVPAENVQRDVLKIPDDLSFEEATLIEPMACCIRAISKCDVQLGDAVAIIGAGPAGIIHAELAKILGAGIIIISDFIEYRLEAAKRFGVDVAINPSEEDVVERVREATNGRGADVVIVTAPSVEALSTGIDVCRRGGVLCLFAPTSPDKNLVVSPHKLFFFETSIIPSYSTSHFETRIALRLIRSKRVRARELITHRFKLDQVGDAIRLASKSGECLKIIVVNE